MKNKRIEMIVALIEACEGVVDVQTAPDYAEPGYNVGEAGVIAFANWNDRDEYDPKTQTRVKTDDTPSILCTALEALGVDIEWSDEWSRCSDCGKAFRTSPDGYDWKRQYAVIGECDEVCHECIKEDPDEYLEQLEGTTSAMTLDGIDLEKAGYVKLASDLENGFHSGMDADPKVIAKSLKSLGVDRFIFTLDEASQFYVTFGVWIAKEELETLDRDKWERAAKNGASVSDGLRRALQSVTMTPPQDGGVMVTKLDVESGTSETHEVSREDFVLGKAFDSLCADITAIKNE